MPEPSQLVTAGLKHEGRLRRNESRMWGRNFADIPLAADLLSCFRRRRVCQDHVNCSFKARSWLLADKMPRDASVAPVEYRLRHRPGPCRIYTVIKRVQINPRFLAVI